MYNDVFSLIMAAEESMIKADLEISAFDDNSFDTISAMEAAVSGSYSGGMALESIFTGSDDYGWGAAMEADSESSDEDKPNIFKRIGAAIVGVFRKLGELFNRIKTRIGEWWRTHFNKSAREARKQTAAGPATLNYHSNPHPSDPTANGQKVKDTSRKYFDALMQAVSAVFKPSTALLNIVTNLKMKFFGTNGQSRAYTTDNHNTTEGQLQDAKDLLDKAASVIADAKDAKVDFGEAAAAFRNTGESYKQYLGNINPQVLESNINKIQDNCTKHAEFCTKFADEYKRISGNAKSLSAASKASYSETVDFDGNRQEIHASGLLEKDLYAAAKSYLEAGTMLNDITGEYTIACNMFMG